MDGADGEVKQQIALPAGPWLAWNRGSTRLAVLVTLAYGIAAWISLYVLTAVSGIAIFWPASGIAAGLAIALGRPGYAPIAIGTTLGTLAANLLHGRSPWISAIFGLLNAAEALLTAILYDAAPHRDRASQRILRVVAFFMSALAGAIVCGFDAALLIAYGLQDPNALPHLWQTWTLSDFVGIAVLAPFVVAAVGIAGAPEIMRTHDWRPDIAAMAALVVIAYHTLGLRFDDGYAISIAPGAVLLPILVWLAGRAQPIASSLAVVLIAMLMAYFASTGIGRFGDARLPAEARILAAQIALTLMSAGTQMIVAIYAEQRRTALRLKASERQLAAIAAAAPGVVFSLETKPDGSLSFPFVSPASSRVLDIPAAQLGANAGVLLDGFSPASRDALLAAVRESAADLTVLSLELPLERFGAPDSWIEIKASPVRDESGRVVWHGFIQEVTMRRRILEEMGHRARNLLTVVQAIAEHTARNTKPEDVGDVLAERLDGLLASHRLLAAYGWQGAEMKRLAEAQLAHLAGLLGDRLSISGPPVVLKPEASQVIGMAVHELATNACKHGALSRGTGTVDLSWRLTEADPRYALEVTWVEAGGTPLSDGREHGFGHKITVDVPTYQLHARVTLAPRPDGLIWRLAAPTGCLASTKDREGAWT